MMGEISDELRINLQRFIFAIASRDARGWVTACERLGVLLPSADTVILEQAISELFTRYGGVGVADLVQVDPNEIKEFAIRFSEIVRTLPFQLPNNFLFLARAVSLISGVTSSLNRDFNMWDAVDPFARTLLNRAGANTLSGFGKEALSTLNTLVRLPQRIDAMVTRAERGELVIRNPELERRVRMLDSSARRTTSSVIFAALLLGGVLIFDRNQTLAYLMLTASLIPLLHALGIGRLRK